MEDSVIITTIGTLIGVVAFTVLGLFLKESKRAAADKVIDFAIPIAFNVVNEIAKRTPNKIDDKIALGLQVLAEYVKTHNIELKPEHEVRAKLQFNALHAEATAKKVTAEALTKVLETK